MLRSLRFTEKPRVLRLLAVLSVLVVSGCTEDSQVPMDGESCSEGLVGCGGACVDLQSDAAHCGACGAGCGPGGLCQQATCGCAGELQRCGDTCVATRTDTSNCGGCGRTCFAGQVCAAGLCGDPGCPPGASRCGETCVNLQSDPLNCGSCGSVCESLQGCHGGLCGFDVVAACREPGLLVGIQAGTDLRGPGKPFGSTVRSLALWRDALLVGDDTRAELLQTYADPRLGLLVEQDALGDGGSAPEDIVFGQAHLYVADSLQGTVHQFRPVGHEEGFGLGLRRTGAFELGASSRPQALAHVGGMLYVALAGPPGTGSPRGGAVVRLEETDTRQLRLVDAVPLAGLDLKPFDGGTPLAMPRSATVLDGRVYVALANVDSSNESVPGGPGMLARIDSADGGVRAIDLGAERCLLPGHVEAVGGQLVVSCQGDPRALSGAGSPRGAGLVLLKDDVPVDTYEVSSGCAPGTSGCHLSEPGRFAVAKGAVFLADTHAGRVFVVEVHDGQFVERRGFSTPHAQGPALDVCPPAPGQSVSRVADIVAIPSAP